MTETNQVKDIENRIEQAEEDIQTILNNHLQHVDERLDSLEARESKNAAGVIVRPLAKGLFFVSLAGGFISLFEFSAVLSVPLFATALLCLSGFIKSWIS